MKLASGLALLSLSACAVTVQPSPSAPAAPPAEPAPAPAPAPPPAPVATAAPVTPPAADDADLPADAPKEAKQMIAAGRPKGYKAGAAEAYWIWQDAKGTHWHIRTTTKSAQHRFHGVAVADADLKNVAVARAETGGFKMKGTKRASFEFTTEKESDGLDFDVANNSCVRFVLFIDGKRAETEHVRLGKDAQHPQDSNFKLCP